MEIRVGKKYVQIMATCPTPSHYFFPHTYDNFVMCFIDIEAIERYISVAYNFLPFHNTISFRFGV